MGLSLVFNEAPAPLSEFLDTYRTQGFQQIEGWCADEMFKVCSFIDELQRSKKVSGGACEIGVNQGKFFILLNALVDENETSYAIDLFENQEFNVDHSSGGPREAFEKHLAKFDRHEGSNVKIITADSTDSALRPCISGGRIRMLSVDGGRTAEHVVGDLSLASQIITNGGVVIVNDVMHYHWIGVIEGIFKFLMQSPALVPFAIGFNRLFMCKLSWYPIYFNAFNSSAMRKNTVPMLGRQVVVL